MSLRKGTRKRISNTRVAKKELQKVFNSRAVFATGALRIMFGSASKVKDKNNPDVEMFSILMTPPLARAICVEMGWSFEVLGDGAVGFNWPGIATDMGADETIDPFVTSQQREPKAADGGPLIIPGR